MMPTDDLILGSKPMSDLTDDELRAGIEQLQSKREALVAEARARVAAGRAPAMLKPRAAPKPKIDPFMTDMLAMLKGNKND